MNYTKDELLRAGHELRRIMKSQSFEMAVDLLRQDLTSQIVSSGYGDSALREQNYRKIVALDDLLVVMQTLSFAAERDAMGEDTE